MIRSRLHLQIYLTVVACIVLAAVLFGGFFSLVERDRSFHNVHRLISKITVAVLPDARLSKAEQSAILTELGAELEFDMALFTPDGERIAAWGTPGPFPRAEDIDDIDEIGKFETVHRPRGFVMKLADGRWFRVDTGRIGGPPPFTGIIAMLALLTIAIGLGAWPFVRRLTGRLERLKSGVEQVGDGNLSSRVEVEGRDEIAALATSFNVAAEKVEALVNSQRALLANASHELRTPLARLRMGLELLKDDPDGKRQQEMRRDIGELDGLIDEILVMSRLESGYAPVMEEGLDFTALVAEECSRFSDCTLEAQAGELRGNAKMLQRLVRNLIDNACKHGRPPVEVSVELLGDIIRLKVRDHGAGLDEANRERLFGAFSRGANKQNVEGYGLGLSLVRQIAEAHGGAARLVSPTDNGPGLVAEVDLPV